MLSKLLKNSIKSTKRLKSHQLYSPFGSRSKILSPNHTHVTLDSDYNRDGLLSEVTQVFRKRNLDLRYIDGKVLNREKDGSEKVRMNISYISNSPNEKKEEIKNLKKDLIKNGVKLRSTLPPVVEWFPVEEDDLNLLGVLLQTPEDGLNQDHPGFTDKVYKERRNLIAENSKNYIMNDPIPGFEYSKEETELWQFIWDKLHPLLMEHGCKEYKNNFSKLENAGLFKRSQIPQLEDLNKFLKSETNWRIKPVNGILSQREFLNCLAFRTFCCTQYIRHHSKPEYTPEPDILHEFIGHVPMFSDPVLCDISQLIGILSLGASDAQVAQLGSIYWFTIEFGLCWEQGVKKFYGAGVASSYGEIQHMVQCDELRELDVVNNPPPVNFVVQDVQPFYYVAKSFQNVLEQLQDLNESWPKRFNLSYDAEGNSFVADRAVVLKERPKEFEGLSF